MKKFYTINTLVFCFVCTLCTGTNKRAEPDFWPEEKSPELIGKKVTEDLLNRGEFMMYISDHCNAVHYAEVCAAFGAARLAALLGDTVTIQRLSERYMRVIDEKIVNSANHVDANVYGILPLELYIQTGSDLFFRQGIELADIQWADPLPDGITNQARYWIDDIWMIGSLQVQAYRATGNMVYLERAALTIDSYVLHLQQPNGLFHHGKNAPFFWGRGNGWVAAGLAELLSVLPDSNPHYSSILEGYTKMMDALLNYQADDGMWRQLIDVDSAWKETSGTAMFAYAMATGVKGEILIGGKYIESCRKAWLSLIDYITPEGKITDVCVGTGQSTDINYYLERPRTTGDLHGQAPVLWLAYRLLIE